MRLQSGVSHRNICQLLGGAQREMRAVTVLTVAGAPPSLVSFLVDSFVAAFAMLGIVSVFALIGSGRRTWGGRTSFVQAFFVLIFAFAIVGLLSGAMRGAPAAQAFGVIVLMPILGVGIGIGIFLLRVRFKRDH